MRYSSPSNRLARSSTLSIAKIRDSMTSRHFLACALDRKIDLVHIQPGKPTQNPYVGSFNSQMREECRRVSWFQNLFRARRIIALGVAITTNGGHTAA